MNGPTKPDTDRRAASPATYEPEARWAAAIAVLAVGGIYLALPAGIAVGPRWLLPILVVALLTGTILSHRRGHPYINTVLGHLLNAVITLFMIWSLVLLVMALPAHKESPLNLLQSAASLWITNVIVFASWYWRLDAGGPHQRARRHGHPTGAFLFPQMTAPDPHRREPDGRPWSPRFVDYLFLAFNTSTAFSPTDAPALSRWAKCLMMIQSLISLMTTVILIGRAINIM